MRFYNILISFGLALLMVGCNSGPKQITPAQSGEKGNTQSTGIFDNMSADNGSTSGQIAPVSTDEMHTVTANEVIPADRYVYVNVTEGDNTYWVASRKQEVKTGATYFYKGGLLKTNFESKEHNRVFDKIYLISQLVPADHTQSHPEMAGMGGQMPEQKAQVAADSKERNFQVEGSIKIKEVVENKEKYAGKEVQLTGEVTKVNPNIMGRNWIHLKDGSKDDFDFVLTTDVDIPVGAVVTLSGKVTLNKDFGAGYFYEIILEDAKLVGK